MQSTRIVEGEAQERFLREGRASVSLRSHHVARALDVGTLDNGVAYMVMEYLDGADLQAIMAQRGPLSVEEAVEYVLHACEAIAEAHAAGIVHRDLKPANLFLTTNADGSPCVKVLDFGISKIMGAESALTGDAQALGSPLYMSPEQMGSSKDVDTRTDIWSMGVVLYELLAGKTPFHADIIQHLCVRVVYGTATPIEQFRPGIPAALEAVLAQCFQKERDRRWPTIAAFAAALGPFATDRAQPYATKAANVMRLNVTISRPTDMLPTAPQEVQRSPPHRLTASPPVLAVTEPDRPRRARGVAIVAAIIAGIAGQAVVMMRRPRDPEVAPVTVETAPVPAASSSTLEAPPLPATVSAPAVPSAVSPPATPSARAIPTVRKTPGISGSGTVSPVATMYKRR